MAEGVDLRTLGEALHERLLANDPFAPVEIAETFLLPLANALRKHFSDLRDPQLADTAATDSLMSYFSNPGKYDPTQRSLLGYLYMDARGDLLNLIAKERRRAEKVVELLPSTREHIAETVGAGDEAEESLSGQPDRLADASPVVRRVLAKVTDQTDRRLLEMMTSGVRKTEEYAEVLGISHLPTDEQKAVVKRHKDRLKAAVKRTKKPRD